MAPGLDRTDRQALARRIAGLGFNSVRLPFSLWMTGQTAPVADQYLAANPDLAGATPMEVYDACVQALTGEGLIVIPNCHILDPGWCCADDDENGLWYNRRWPASTFFAAWQGIAARYRANRRGRHGHHERTAADDGGLAGAQPDLGYPAQDRHRGHVHHDR